MKLTRSTRLAAAGAATALAAAGLGLVLSSAFAGAASPTVTLSPATGSQAGYGTVVTGSGFDPTAPITITECTGTTASVTDDSTCNAGVADTNAQADRTGAFTYNGYEITMFSTADSGEAGVQCNYTTPCVLYVGEQLSDFTQPHVLMPFTFQPMAVAPVSTSPISASVVAGHTTTVTINYGTAHDQSGAAETITGNSTVVSAPTKGTVTSTSSGVFTYTSTNASATSDSFTVAGATASCAGTCADPTTATGNNVVVNVTITPVSAVGPVSPSPQALADHNLSSASITIKYGTANDTAGGAESITGNSTVVTGPTNGTVSSTSPGVFTYTSTSPTATSDSFTVKGATASCVAPDACASTATGNNIVVNVTLKPQPSVLTVHAALAEILPAVNLYLFTVGGTLTVNGHGLAGQTVTFTAGSTVICSGVTTGTGAVSCSGTGSALNIILGVGYDGTFKGAPELGVAGSTGHGPLLSIDGINII